MERVLMRTRDICKFCVIVSGKELIYFDKYSKAISFINDLNITNCIILIER